MKEKPFIIFLNGTSSAGKTSIAAEIQAQSEQPILHVGIDHFLSVLPPHYIFEGKNADEGYHFIKEEGPKVTIKVGSVGKALARAMRRSLKTLLDHHFNLLVDEVLFADEDYHDYLDVFKGYRLFFIGVKPPLEVAIQREAERGDRILGLAHSLHDKVHREKTYDLLIDSSKTSPEESAKLILQHVNRHQKQQVNREDARHDLDLQVHQVQS